MNNQEPFWNKLSKNYDKKAKDEAYHSIIKKSKKYFKKSDVMLDFACATGLYAVEFANDVSEIEAFDISSEMIKIAKSKAVENQINNISFSQTTLDNKKFKRASFNTVLALNILLYFKDCENVLNRMNYLLKPNGLMITSTACLKEKRTFIGILSSCIIFILKKLKILPYLRFFTRKELEEKIESCGFKIIETAILIDKPATEYYIVAQKIN
ncbi:methyltransferase domain-containing protein [Polaribacter pectinis]|uniref:Methyltransferase domain-containing protein n=1 Tax=Polaribacter pectinis TaxID=2738844 RepID=A0A7G9L8Z4_9FLAO|nr:class I SAM-dependent methyltransferase [Polaribacter pectinis]QNM85093.1 methyltransferase domain-containing protein [Polaribacter pectinis]